MNGSMIHWDKATEAGHAGSFLKKLSLSWSYDIEMDFLAKPFHAVQRSKEGQA